MTLIGLTALDSGATYLCRMLGRHNLRPDDARSCQRFLGTSNLGRPFLWLRRHSDLGMGGRRPTDFAVPVTVGLPIDDDTPAGEALAMVRYDETTGAWETLEGTSVVGDDAIAKTLLFSPFALFGGDLPAGCDNQWGGGPGAVAPMLRPGGVVVSPATRVSEDLVNSGSAQMALGSVWTTEACIVTVKLDAGEGVDGTGGWIDWQSGATGDMPLVSGFYTAEMDVRAPNGPYFGVSDACHAPTGADPHNLATQVAADYLDQSERVTCGGRIHSTRCLGDIT